MDKVIARSRELRRSMKPEEVRVWVRLRDLRQIGFHFRRQALIEGYYPDFVCKKNLLIIEIDGSQHGEEPQLDHDRHRDAKLRAKGYRILLFWNSDIGADLEAVMDTIQATLAGSY